MIPKYYDYKQLNQFIGPLSSTKMSMTKKRCSVQWIKSRKTATNVKQLRERWLVGLNILGI